MLSHVLSEDGYRHTGLLLLLLLLLLGCFAVRLIFVQHCNVNSIRCSYRRARGAARGHPGPGPGEGYRPGPVGGYFGSKNSVSICTRRPNYAYRNYE